VVPFVEVERANRRRMEQKDFRLRELPQEVMSRKVCKIVGCTLRSWLSGLSIG
jgi:hypothetical protein